MPTIHIIYDCILLCAWDFVVRVVNNTKSVDIVDDKAVQKMLRDAAVARYGERSAQLKEQQSQVKHEQGKFAVRQQMKVLVVFE